MDGAHTEKRTEYGVKPPVTAAGAGPGGSAPPALKEVKSTVKQAVKRALIASLGRPVRCELCGEVLFRAVPIVRSGRVKLVGAEYALVRVDFASMNHLSFRHVEADRCSAQGIGR